MEINQYGITMATHYDITMGNDIVGDVHFEITMGNIDVQENEVMPLLHVPIPFVIDCLSILVYILPYIGK